MGGLLRCIRNDYNLDDIENDLNKEDDLDIGEHSFDQRNIKINDNNNNGGNEIEGKNLDENDHYASNILSGSVSKRSVSIFKDSVLYNK